MYEIRLKLQYFDEEGSHFSSQARFISPPGVVRPFNAFALFRLGKIMAKFKELVGRCKIIPAS